MIFDIRSYPLLRQFHGDFKVLQQTICSGVIWTISIIGWDAHINQVQSMLMIKYVMPNVRWIIHIVAPLQALKFKSNICCRL